MKLENQKYDKNSAKLIGKMWREQDPEVQIFFQELSVIAEKNHSLKYPDYEYSETIAASKQRKLRKRDREGIPKRSKRSTKKVHEK